MHLIPGIYYAFYLTGIILASVLGYSVLFKFAQTLGIRNPDEKIIRWSSNAKPSIGGLGFYFAFLISILVYDFIFSKISHSTIEMTNFGIIIAASIAFLTGLADDAYNTNPLLKFVAQLICGVVLASTGLQFNLFNSDFANFFITIFFVAGIMNSVNMLDNMDGITTIISLCAFALFSGILYQMNNYFLISVTIGLFGVLVAFLFYNWHPSKFFMGDTGSQFLGLILSAIALHIFTLQSNTYSAVEIINKLTNIVLCLLIPVCDTATVTINRLRKGNSPFVGGKDHTTHFLVYRGLTEKKTALLILILQSIAAVLAYINFESASENMTLFTWIGIIYSIAVFSLLYLNTLIRSDEVKK